MSRATGSKLCHAANVTPFYSPMIDFMLDCDKRVVPHCIILLPSSFSVRLHSSYSAVLFYWFGPVITSHNLNAQTRVTSSAYNQHIARWLVIKRHSHLQIECCNTDTTVTCGREEATCMLRYLTSPPRHDLTIKLTTETDQFKSNSTMEASPGVVYVNKRCTG